MTLLPIRLGAMVLIWQHPVFFNPTLLHFALTNVNFCCLLQAHSLIQPTQHAPLCHSSCHDPRGSLGTRLLPSITSATGKREKLNIWKKGDGEKWDGITFSSSFVTFISTAPCPRCVSPTPCRCFGLLTWKSGCQISVLQTQGEARGSAK